MNNNQDMDTEARHRGLSAGAVEPRRFRIFLASPGDVQHERTLAREAIIHIGSERRFRGRISLETVAWDQPGAAVAMEAGLTPQEAIAQGLPKPEDCDLAVIVLWSRIGTRIPADFELKEDGSPYFSGTEWEYLNALKGFTSKGKPAVWLYRRHGAPNPNLDDPNYASIVDQWNKLQQFFSRFNNPDGSPAGGINHYESPDHFRKQFEHHLRDRLDKLLETMPAANHSQPISQPITAPVWTKSPYPGLKSFTPEQWPIFFGRGAEIDQLLNQFADPQVRFIAVVGVSGSGKSSLVKAGLLPRLRAGIIGHAPWIDLSFKPGERGGNPYLALAYALKSELEFSGRTEREIARELQADAKVAERHLTELLAQRKPAAELLIFVDQFEELFTQSTEKDRKDFFSLLDALVAQPQFRVIVTMRADFFTRATEEPTVANLLRRDRGTFPLNPPGLGAIHEMIIRPAEAAGVDLQEGLAQRLIDDAGEGPGAMALIAFTLNQLYRRGQGSRILSLDAYQNFGGVQGAIQERAESALQGLSVNPELALPKLFANLVEVNEQEVATRRRAVKSLLAEDAKAAADALTEARVLVGGEGENDLPTLEVAHETVLKSWDRLDQWIHDHAETLRARRDLERAAGEWDRSGRHGGALRTGRLLRRYLASAEPHSSVAKDYLAACMRRRSGIRIGYSALILFGVAVLVILFHVNQSDYPPALAAKALFVQSGIWPVTEPVMVEIPAGVFEMGDTNGDPDEKPVHPVRFAKSFDIGKTEVTFAEYDLFAAATGRDKPSDEDWGRGKLPAINVSWEDAVAYAEWLTERTGLKYRLPSEAEWEYAARATSTTVRYWPENSAGEKDAACTYANVFDKKNESHIKGRYPGITREPFDCADEFPFTAPVGQFIANQWGLHDMLGNVWEWNQDCYVDRYEGAPSDGSPRESTGGDCSLRVLRGGSWSDRARSVRSASRDRSTPVIRDINVGFRLARTD